MSNLTLPPASVPPLDARGLMSIAWYRWASDATARMGGVTGSSTGDLTASQFEDAGIEETKAALYRLGVDLMQAPAPADQIAGGDVAPSIDQLRAEVEQLRRLVADILQGTSA